MKKLILTLFILPLIFTGLSLKAQTGVISLSNYTQTIYTNDLNTDFDSHVTVENHGSSDVPVMVERTINTLAPGHMEYFCTNILCYPPGTAVSSSPDIIAANGASFFKATVRPMGVCGFSSLHYRFYDQNNPADSVGVTLDFQFCFSGVGLNENKNDFGFSKPLRNPADAFTVLTYNLQSSVQNDKLMVYNMLGSLVKSLDVPGKTGSLVVSTSELKAGLYFVTYVSGNKVSQTHKLVVAHK